MSSSLTMNKGKFRLGSKRGNAYSGAHTTRRVKSSAPRSVFGLIKTAVLLAALLALLAGLSTGCLYCYRWVTASPYFSIRQIEVAGLDRLSRGEVLEAGNVRMGVNSLIINVSDVEAGVSSLAWVKSAAVRRELPGSLWVKIQERDPVFWVRDGEHYAYADGEGKVIAPVSPGDFTSLPVLEVDPGSRFAGELVPELLTHINEKKGPFDLSQAAWIKLNANGDLEIYLDKEDLTLRLHASDWQTQLDRMGAVHADLAGRGELKYAAVISAGKNKIWIKRRG